MPGPTVTYSWIQTKADFLLNDVVSYGAQNLAAVASINGGASYFSAWYTNSSIGARIVDRYGVPIGSEFEANATTINVQTDPSVVQLTGGNVIVTYTDYSVNSFGDIRARFYSSTAVPGAEIIIANTTGQETDSDVAALANGGFVVTWTRTTGGIYGSSLLAGIYDANGINTATVFPGDDNSGFYARVQSQVVGLSNGNFVVVWQQTGVYGGDSEVLYQIFGPSGASITAKTVVATTGSINEDIQIVALKDGGFAVAYTDNGWGISQTEISLNIYNADGSPRIPTALLANTVTLGIQDNPTLTTLSNGFIVLGWSSGNDGYYQAFTPLGALVGVNALISTSMVEGEIAGMTAGLVANTFESTISDGAANSIQSSVNELIRTTVGDASNDTLVGDSLRDFINGGDGNDIITGGLGSDVLTGGAGADIFRDTRNALRDDTITDFSNIDRIHFTDAVASIFTYSQAGTVLNYMGSLMLNFSSAPVDRIVARAAPSGGVELLLHDANNDFDGDGRSDILWRDSGNGNVTNWLGQANGGFVGNFANANLALTTDWKIAGVGDFNGDGRDDILWRNSNGTVTDWLGTASGGFIGNFANANLALTNDWKIAGTGDFNGDGYDDVLWRNTNGTVTDWLGNASGGFTGNFANANLALTSDWQVAAVGDYNGDGRDDILWRNTNGTVTNWLGNSSGGFTGNFANANLALTNSWQTQPHQDYF